MMCFLRSKPRAALLVAGLLGYYVWWYNFNVIASDGNVRVRQVPMTRLGVPAWTEVGYRIEIGGGSVFDVPVATFLFHRPGYRVSEVEILPHHEARGGYGIILDNRFSIRGDGSAGPEQAWAEWQVTDRGDS